MASSALLVGLGVVSIRRRAPRVTAHFRQQFPREAPTVFRDVPVARVLDQRERPGAEESRAGSPPLSDFS